MAGMVAACVIAAPALPQPANAFTEQQKLTPFDGAENDRFGAPVALEGDTAIIGARLDDDNGKDSGSAYVFRFDDESGLWEERQKLTASDGAAEDRFGFPIVLDGDTAIIGAFFDDNLGSAYVFGFDDESGLWEERQKLTASDAGPADLFGVSIALDGDTAVIGANEDDDKGSSAGSAYVFSFDDDTGLWEERQKLTASDRAAGDRFGIRVALSNDTAIVCALTDNDNGIDSGSAYVFRFNKDTGLWEERQKLLASDGAADDLFCGSVVLEGDVAMIGANCDDDDGEESGSAYVFGFDEDAGLWQERQKLTASDAAAGDRFGGDISLDEETAVIGADRDDDNGDNAGSAYVFHFDDDTGLWRERRKLTASDGEPVDLFGFRVALDDDTALIGAPRTDDNGAISGSAYVFIDDDDDDDDDDDGDFEDDDDDEDD